MRTTDLLNTPVAICVLEHLRKRVDFDGALCAGHKALERHGYRRSSGEWWKAVVRREKVRTSGLAVDNHAHTAIRQTAPEDARGAGRHVSFDRSAAATTFLPANPCYAP
jgi:hypothetical protein